MNSLVNPIVSTPLYSTFLLCKNFVIIFGKVLLHQINWFWIKPNLLSEERSFTKKEFFLLCKNFVIIFGKVLLHQINWFWIKPFFLKGLMFQSLFS